jgi:hypothetical protein
MMAAPEEEEAVPQSMLSTELSLTSLTLVAEDGEEEPLVLPAGTGCHPQTADIPIRNRVALLPDARFVKIRAFTRSRRATVSICRWDDSATPPARQAADLINRTIREKALPEASASQVSSAVRMQAAWRGHLTRREEGTSGMHAVEPPMRRIAADMLQVGNLARAARVRWKRATTLHRNEARGKAATSKGKSGSEARLGILLIDHDDSHEPFRDPMEQVSVEFKTFLRSNWLAIHSELSRHDFEENGGQRSGLCDKSTFESVLYELSLPRTPRHAQDFPMFYVATGLHPSIPDAKLRFEELPMFLFAMRWERDRDHTCQVSLSGATRYYATKPTNKKGAKAGKGKGSGKSSSPPRSPSPDSSSSSSTSPETVASFRICVMGDDLTCCLYRLDVLIAPPERPFVPPMPTAAASLLSTSMLYYGELVPYHLANELSRTRNESELVLQQRRSIAAGTAVAGEHAVDVERFISCCTNLRIATTAVARLAFEGVSRERPDAVLGTSLTWKAIFLCFVRQASARPLVRLAPYQLDYSPEAIMASLSPCLALIQYNLSAAASYNMCKLVQLTQRNSAHKSPQDAGASMDSHEASARSAIVDSNDGSIEITSGPPSEAQAILQPSNDHPTQTREGEMREYQRSSSATHGLGPASYTRSAPMHASGIYPPTSPPSKATGRTALERRRLFRPNSPNPALAPPGLPESTTPKTTPPASPGTEIFPMPRRFHAAPPGAVPPRASSCTTKRLDQLLQEEQEWAQRHFRPGNRNADANSMAGSALDTVAIMPRRTPPTLPAAQSPAIRNAANGLVAQQALLLNAWQTHLGMCWRAGHPHKVPTARSLASSASIGVLHRKAPALQTFKRTASTSDILREHAQQSLTLLHAVTATAQPLFAQEADATRKSSNKAKAKRR